MTLGLGVGGGFGAPPTSVWPELEADLHSAEQGRENRFARFCLLRGRWRPRGKERLMVRRIVGTAVAVALGFALGLGTQASADHKTLIDHKGKQICVSDSAVPAHVMNHGDDVLGDC